MKGINNIYTIFSFLIISILIITLSNTTLLSYEASGTTVIRRTNRCAVELIFQIALITDMPNDKNKLQASLNRAFDLDCQILCPLPIHGEHCPVRITVTVELLDDIDEQHRDKFHKITMKNGVRSQVDARGIVNGPSTTGTWDRGNSDQVNAHEVLHLGGLSDKYCEMFWFSRTSFVIKKFCDPPGPGIPCCLPLSVFFAQDIMGFCTRPCPGFQNDIMGTCEDNVDCFRNIIPIIEAGGENFCPEVCCDRPMPIELLNFFSAIYKNNVNLSWSTTRETNNTGFNIERTLINSTSWTKIGFVEGNGTSSEPRKYFYSDKNLNSGKYNYRLKQIDFNGNFQYFDLQNEVVIGVPEKYNLHQNYPNPFNPTTKIDFELPKDGNVTMTVYDNNGKLVSTIVNEYKPAGYYSVEFNVSNLASGVYLYKIAIDEGMEQQFTVVKKMVIMK